MMTLDEKCDIYEKADELRKQGKIEEADELENQVPIASHLAKIFKEVYGVERVKELNLNFSEAEEVYGKDWLTR